MMWRLSNSELRRTWQETTKFKSDLCSTLLYFGNRYWETAWISGQFTSLRGFELRTFRIQVGNFAATAILPRSRRQVHPPARHSSIHPKIQPTIHPFIHPLFPLSSVKEENNTNIYLPSLRYILGIHVRALNDNLCYNNQQNA